MAVIIPKDMRGFWFAKAVPFELNGALVEILLTNVFQRAILENRDLARTNIDAADIDGPTRRLADSDQLEGFDGFSGHRMLEKMVKSSLITIGYKGNGRKESDKQIEGIVPYSIASFKTGLPKSRTRLRSIDQFVYYLLLIEFDGAPEKVSSFLAEVFGQGVKVRGYPEPGFTRDHLSDHDLDVLTDLSIAYLQGIESVTPRRTAPDRLISQPLPGFQQRFGNDLYRYLWSYRDRVPATILVDQFTTLIAFEIAVFTIKLLDALPMLTADPETIPEAMTPDRDLGAGPALYVDMDSDIRGISRTMAVACVRRDLSSIEPFIRSVLTLRYLDSLMAAMMRNPKLRPRLANLPPQESTPEYLQAILTLGDDPVLQVNLDALAGHDLSRINEANVSTNGDGDDEDFQEPNHDFGHMETDDLTLEEQVVQMLYDTQVSIVKSGIIKWLTSVGGVNTNYGLINGRADRRSWAYAPPNDLLTVLVQLRAIDYKGWNPARGANPEPFSVPEFLEWLEDRFGIIVDRPPPGLGFDGPEHMAAARDNLRAMLRRLRQMGVFEDQSDDFSVQTLTPPYMDPAPAAPSTHHA